MNIWFLVETFGTARRPIVEFAIDNVQTLKLRNAKLRAWSQDNTTNFPKALQRNADTNAADILNKKNSRKRKATGDDRPVKELHRNEDENSRDVVEGSRATKKQKKRPEGGNTNEPSKQKPKPKGRRLMPEKSSKKSPSLDTGKVKASQEADVHHKKKVQHQPQQEQQRKRPKKNKDPIGQDTVDKLDMLIEQYRSKFSHQGSDATDGENRGSKQVRKWFQS